MGSARLSTRLVGAYACLACAGAASLAAGPAFASAIRLPLAAVLLALAGLVGTATLARARCRAARFDGPPLQIGLAARRPQAILVPLFAASAILCALRPPIATQTGMPLWMLLAACVAAFALLVGERQMAVIPPARLPEGPALSRLLRVPIVVVLASAGLAAAPGGWTRIADQAIGLGITAIAAELGLRALGRWFLPPPEPALARAPVDLLLLRVAGRAARGDVAAPLRDHFGLDFSRSWALAYARAAALPTAALLLVGAWLLSGLAVVPADRRAVEERFGRIAAVLPPGLHAILPWPLGRAVTVEFGTIHEATLSGAPAEAAPVAAEALPPPGADRLWEQAHPAEQSFLVASETTGGRQSFQVLNADIRLLYRVGLGDADARRFVLATADADALVRAAAGRAVASSLAGRTLPGMLGDRREGFASGLRAAAQGELDGLGGGLELVAVVLEAIHPPPGAADAYHAVQAAEIAATTTVSTERGRAQAALAMARQQATTMVDTAQGSAADTTEEAATHELRFTADRTAAAAGGRAFLMERYYENLVLALSGTPKTIVDARLGATAPAVIDLRPLLPGSPAAKED